MKGMRSYMANCPKCNAHLKISDWRQHCPHCGANITVYDLQERLMQDADIAEVQNYHFQKKIDRIKTAFIGSPLAITRIFTSLLPAGPLFLTIIKATFSGKLAEASGDINFMTIYNNFDKLGDVLGLFSGNSVSDKLFVAAFGVFFLSVLATVVRFVLNALACSPKGKIRNYSMDIILLVTSIIPAILIFAMSNDGVVKASIGIGAILYIVCQIVNVVIDVLFFKKGFEIKHQQCYVGGIPIEEYFEMEKTMSREEIRAEQYKRLQALQDEKERELNEKAKANSERKDGE